MSYSNLSLAIFVSMKKAVVATLDNVYEIDVGAEGLPGEGLYLTNLERDEINATKLSSSDKQRLLPKNELLVNPAYIAKELGVRLEKGIDDYSAGAFKAILQGYLSALFRLRFHVQEIKGNVRSSLVKHIKNRTMASDFREANCEGIDNAKLNIGVHSWVVTGKKASASEHIRTIHLDRAQFYFYLLNQELPIDTWEAGDPSLPLDLIMKDAEDLSRSLLVEGCHKENCDYDFVSGCKTDETRNMYIPSELLSLNEEQASFVMKEWWKGGMLKPRSPYSGINTMSLADSLVMEMIYRSWRSQSLLGYWLAASERLIMHGIADLLSPDMKIVGYGSGKISVATPNDSQEIDRQDGVFFDLSKDCHIRVPLDPSWNAEKLCKTLPLLSDMQKIAASSMKALADIDKAIDSHDNDALQAARHEARKSLEEKIA